VFDELTLRLQTPDSRLQTLLLLNSHAWTKRSSLMRRTLSDVGRECEGACAPVLRRAWRLCLLSLRLRFSYSRFQISTCGRSLGSDSCRFFWQLLESLNAGVPFCWDG